MLLHAEPGLRLAGVRLTLSIPDEQGLRLGEQHDLTERLSKYC